MGNKMNEIKNKLVKYSSNDVSYKGHTINENIYWL